MTQRYIVTSGSVAVPNSSPVSILEGALSATTPIKLQSVTVTCINPSGNIYIPIAVSRRTSAGTAGGSSVSVTPNNKAPAGPAAAATWTTLFTTVGSLDTNGLLAEDTMNIAAPWFWNWKEDGIEVAVGKFVTVDVLANPTSTFNFAVTVEYDELGR